jgi:hypothetical protein
VSTSGSLLPTLVGTLAFLVGLLMSLQTAHAWGEMAGIAPGGDKTGLGGLFAVLVLLGIEWLAVAAALACGVLKGGFDGWFSARGMQVAVLLGGHLTLGAFCFFGFNWIAEGLTLDQMGPQRLCWLFGVLLPLPALLAALAGLHPNGLTRHPRIALVVALAVVLAHAAIFQHSRTSMLATNARLQAADEAGR